MDLTLLIVLIIAAILIYYLIESIRSLQKEIREVKDKCISTKNTKSEEFTVNTSDPLLSIPNDTVKMLNNLKLMFN